MQLVRIADRNHRGLRCCSGPTGIYLRHAVVVSVLSQNNQKAASQASSHATETFNDPVNRSACIQNDNKYVQSTR